MLTDSFLTDAIKININRTKNKKNPIDCGWFFSCTFPFFWPIANFFLTSFHQSFFQSRIWGLYAYLLWFLSWNDKPICSQTRMACVWWYKISNAFFKNIFCVRLKNLVACQCLQTQSSKHIFWQLLNFLFTDANCKSIKDVKQLIVLFNKFNFLNSGVKKHQ